ncbi:MAG: hypothetical protein KC486_14175 [Myxococcales bacterium]|nr:hypothetical protein [Myxococcales bacterium]
MLHRAAPIVAATSIALLLSACRGDDREFDCSYQAERFAEAAEKEGVLLDAVADVGTYPMAMMISEDGINRLLGGVVGDEIPFASEMQLGPTQVKFTPTSTPTIDVASVPTCAQCVLFSLDFKFGVVQGEDGLTAGLGDAFLAIPIRLDAREDGTAVLVAEYQNATVSKMDISANGFDSENHEAISGALALLATDIVREQYGETELLVIGSLDIGGNDVRALARDLFVVPDLDAIVLGMETNLELPAGTGLDQPEALPEGTPMGILFDPQMILAVAQRMIVEGEIPRRYDEDGNASDDGIYGVTLDAMAPGTVNDDRLDTTFRVWRTDEGYCGYAIAEMPLILSLDSDAGLKVNPGDANVVGGEGSGRLAADREELIQKNQGLIDNFKASLAEQVGLTLNYRSIGVEGSSIFFEPLDISVTQSTNSVNFFLDFVVAANE